MLDDAEIKGNENIKFLSKEKERKEVEQKDSYIFQKEITYFIEIKESIFGIKDKLYEAKKKLCEIQRFIFKHNNKKLQRR